MKKVILAFSTLLCLILGACGSDNDDVSITTPTDNSTDNNKSTTVTIDSTYTYELPVIFHVLYKDKNDASQYIPYQRLSNILNYVNEIYQGNIYGESENINIKFTLATKDENGKTLEHPGVEYVYYSGDYPIDVNEFMNDQTGANVKYIWEPNDYINIVMFNFKSSDNDESTTLGISDLPYSVKGDHELEGLETIPTNNVSKKDLPFAYCSAINSLYANQSSEGRYYQSDRYTNRNHQPSYITSLDVVVTIAHELGHYLGLYHAFTESKDNDSVEPVDSCGDTDYCTDTYSYNRHDYLEYLNYVASSTNNPTANQLLVRHSCDSTEYYSANIMDYSMTLGYKISNEQKKRIRHVLYYSPLIPGPKLYSATKTTRAAVPVRLKPTLIK